MTERPSTCVKWKLTSGEIEKGIRDKGDRHRERRRTPGTGENFFSVSLVNESGEDKTDNYEIEYRFGKLTGFSLSPFRFHGFRG